MSILDSIGYHVEMRQLTAGGTVKYLYPTNTSEDVIVDSNGNNLVAYLPSSVAAANASTTGNPVKFVQKSYTTMDDSVMALILA